MTKNLEPVTDKNGVQTSRWKNADTPDSPSIDRVASAAVPPTSTDPAMTVERSRHLTAVAKMRDAVEAAGLKNVSGVVFAPNEDELDRQWYEKDEDEGEYGDYQDAWLARGDLERQPVGIFTDGDPDNIIDLDDDEHFESGAEYDRDALIKNLTELSKHIDRNSSEFEAIGDYEIYVWLDPEYYKS